jgi:hypothetical protein
MTALAPQRAALAHLAIALAAIAISLVADPQRLARIGAFGIAASVLLLASGPWLAASAARAAAIAGIRVPPLWRWRWDGSSTDPADRAFSHGYCADVIAVSWIAIAATVVLRDVVGLPSPVQPGAWFALPDHLLVDIGESVMVSLAICAAGWALTVRRAARLAR